MSAQIRILFVCMGNICLSPTAEGVFKHYLAEAGLAFAGLGTPAPTPSWGRMLAEALPAIGAAPYLAVFPGLAIMVTALGLGLIADGLHARHVRATGRT